MTLDDVIDKIKKAYTARLTSIRGSVDVLRNAVNSYEGAAQDDALNDFLIINGLLPPATERRSDNAALDLLSAVEGLPELQPPALIQLQDEEAEEELEPVAAVTPDTSATSDSAVSEFPFLHKDGRPILVFGGFVVEEKRRAIERRTGLRVEWISNERNGNGDNDCENACRRLRNGQYCGLIMLNELMSHRQSDALTKATKGAGVHHAVGKKGGTAALLSALSLFEQQRRDVDNKE